MSRLLGILWDLDGVLVDSGAAHFPAWQAVLGPLGIPFSWETFTHTFGMNNAGILELLLGQPPDAETLRRISDAKETAFRQAAPGRVQLLPGAVDWLQRFQAAGLAQAIASSAPQENVDLLAEVTGITSYFTARVSGYALRGKPAPDTFLKAAEALALAPEACLVIEDSLVGIQAARSAGIQVIAVATTHPADQLQAAGRVVAGLDQMAWDDLLGLGFSLG